MRNNWLSVICSLALVIAWTACSDETPNAPHSSAPPDDASGKGNPKSQSSASDYNVSLLTDGFSFAYTVTKNAGAKDLGHFIVNLDNCGDQSPRLASVLSATVNGVEVELQDSEGWGTGCLPVSSNFIKFDDLPDADILELIFTLDMQYSKVASTGWLKAGTSCNATTIEGPGCPVTDCVFGLGHFFAMGAQDWPFDVELGEFTYTKDEGQDLWFGGNDSNVALRAFFRYVALALNDALDDAPQDAVSAIEDYFEGNPNKLTQANINAGHFDNSGLATALSTINDWIDANECEEE